MQALIDELKTNTTAAWPLVILRVATGVMFIIAGYGKVMRGSEFGDAIQGFLARQENMFDSYRGFI